MIDDDSVKRYPKSVSKSSGFRMFRQAPVLPIDVPPVYPCGSFIISSPVLCEKHVCKKGEALIYSLETLCELRGRLRLAQVGV